MARDRAQTDGCSWVVDGASADDASSAPPADATIIFSRPPWTPYSCRTKLPRSGRTHRAALGESGPPLAQLAGRLYIGGIVSRIRHFRAAKRAID